MAFPTADHYGCASGGIIAAGRYVIPPQISGTAWTPDRDVNDNIVAGNWRGLPLNTWLTVSGHVLSDILEQPPLYTVGGYLSAPGIIRVWCGAAWDHVNQKMFMSGGGHGGSHPCETGIYALDAKTLKFTIAKPRTPTNQLQEWNETTLQFDAGFTTAVNPYNNPLINGDPSATHTYHSILWVPPSVMGNTNGGVYIHGSARNVFNLDTQAWMGNTFWIRPYLYAEGWLDYSNSAAFIDGSSIYGPYFSQYHWKYDLTQTQATYWSATSLGKFTAQHAATNRELRVGSSIWGTMPERRESYHICWNGIHTRIRYGQAIDAAATVWNTYTDAITLTSADGSHLDFNLTNLTDAAQLCAAGNVYDHDTQTLYLQGNLVGGFCYKVTGLSGNTWTTEKMAGTGALKKCDNNTYGRMRMARLAGTKLLIRVSAIGDPVQVMRIA